MFKLYRAIESLLAFYIQPYKTLTKISRDVRDVKGTNILRLRTKSCKKPRRFWRQMPPRTAV